MFYIRNWSSFFEISENFHGEDFLDGPTSSNIEKYTDSDENEVEFNKKTMIEITYQKNSNKNIILRKGKYDKQNNKVGIWQEFDPLKNYKIIQHYTDDVLDGPSITIYSSGPVKRKEQNWTKGNLREETIQYTDGRIEKKEFKDDKGKHYTLKIYDVRGKLAQEGQVLNNQRHELWRWYENGNFLCSMFYYIGTPKGWGETPDGDTIEGKEPKK